MLLRGALRRCPFCGGGGLFDSWFNMKEVCPTCKHRFAQEEGFYTGAWALNFVVAEGLVMLCIVPYIILSTAKEQPVWPFVVFAVVFGILGPLVFYPFSRTLWVAVDLMVRGGRNLDR